MSELLDLSKHFQRLSLHLPNNIAPLVLRDYQKGDVFAIDIRADEDPDLPYLLTVIDAGCCDGDIVAYTATVNDNIIASGGFEAPWKGRLNAWMVTSQKASLYKFQISRLCRYILNRYESTPSLLRIDGFIRKGDQQAARWANHLGFTARPHLQNLDNGVRIFHVYTKAV